MPDMEPLLQTLESYKAAIAQAEDGGGASESFREQVFSSPESAAERPWAVCLYRDPDREPGSMQGWVEVILSGDDGSGGAFGHIAAGGGGSMINIYPPASDRGATGKVPTSSYLFSVLRGQSLHRPNWLLRLEGVSQETVEKLVDVLSEEARKVQEDEKRFHPTGNNCAVATLKGLEVLGFCIPSWNPRARKSPRRLFEKLLVDLPEIVEALQPAVVEFWYFPQAHSATKTRGSAPDLGIAH
jgi:hypothetical protein